MSFDYLTVYKGCEGEAEAFIIRMDAIESFELNVNEEKDTGCIVIHAKNHIYFSREYSADHARQAYDRLESVFCENYRVLNID